jgi:hypothetical protein
MDPFRKEKFFAKLKTIGTYAAIGIAVFFLLSLWASYLSRYNVENIAEVKKTIEKSFSENQSQKLFLYADNNEIAIKRGESFGVAFGIKNSGSAGSFTYSIMPREGNCQAPERMITMGSAGSASLASNATFYGLIKIEPEKSMPKCAERFKFEVKRDNESYDEVFFNITISGWF